MQIINSDIDLETEFTSISDRFQYFSSALDSILLQSDEVEDLNIKKVSDSYLPAESCDREVRSIAAVSDASSIATTTSIPTVVAPAVVAPAAAAAGRGISPPTAVVASPIKPIASPMVALKVRNSLRIKDDATTAIPVRIKSVQNKSGNRGSNRLPTPPTASQSANVSWK